MIFGGIAKSLNRAIKQSVGSGCLRLPEGIPKFLSIGFGVRFGQYPADKSKGMGHCGFAFLAPGRSAGIWQGFWRMRGMMYPSWYEGRI